MIEPITAGAALLQAIASAPPSGALVVRLGHAGILVRIGAATVMIDPYLSNHCEAVFARPLDHRRRTRAPLDPAEVESLDLVLCTQDHPDHFDPPTLRSLRDASPSARLLCPNACIELADGLDWPGSRIAGMDTGDVITTDGLVISAFEVAHRRTDAVHGHARFLGYAVRGGGLTLVHVGDARATTSLAATLRALRPDVVFLPINGPGGRHRRQGQVANMTAAEAVGLAVEAGAMLAIPLHYDMFAQSTDPAAVEDFVRCAREAELPVRVTAVGEVVHLEPAGPPGTDAVARAEAEVAGGLR